MLALIAFPFAIGLNLEIQDCDSIESSEARLACYDRKSGRSDSEATGRISGTITWQYNKFVGTRGDTDAKIILIKEPLPEAMREIDAGDIRIMGLGIKPTQKPSVLYATNADGFGRFEKEGIPVGRYFLIVVSKSTRAGPDDFYTNHCTEKLAEFVPDFRAFQKLYCRSVTIEGGRTESVNFDFGNTYF